MYCHVLCSHVPWSIYLFTYLLFKEIEKLVLKGTPGNEDIDKVIIDIYVIYFIF